MQSLINKVKTKDYDSIKWFFVFFVSNSFFNDTYTGYQIVPDLIKDYCQFLTFAVLLILVIKKNKCISKLLFSLFIYEGLWLISTILNYSFDDIRIYHKLLCDIVNSLSMGLLIECFKDDSKNLFKGLMLNFELAIYPNFVTVLLKNSSSHKYYLLGYYAVLTLWIIPAICVVARCVLFFKSMLWGRLISNIVIESSYS